MPGRVPVSGLLVYARVDARVRRGRRDLLQRGVRGVRQSGGALPGRVSLRLGAHGGQCNNDTCFNMLFIQTNPDTICKFRIYLIQVVTEDCHQE